MMDLSQIINVVEIIGIVAILSGLFYAYYKYPKVQLVVKKVLPFLPSLFALLASKATDKKGVFDTHDLGVVLSKLSVRIKVAISDPANRRFEDVQDDIFNFVKEELDIYRKAGVKNVPDVGDETIKVAVRVVFEGIVRATSEDTSGNNQPN